MTVVRRREKPRTLYRASRVGAPVRAPASRTARPKVRATSSGPASATAPIRKNAERPAVSPPRVPDTHSGANAMARPATSVTTAKPLRAHPIAGVSTAEPRTASVGGIRSVSRVASRPASMAVGTSSATAPATGSGDRESWEPGDSIPASCRSGPNRRASRTPGTAPSGTAISATSSTSRETCVRTWRLVAPMVRRRANSRRRPRSARVTMAATTMTTTKRASPEYDDASAMSAPPSTPGPARDPDSNSTPTRATRAPAVARTSAVPDRLPRCARAPARARVHIPLTGPGRACARRPARPSGH